MHRATATWLLGSAAPGASNTRYTHFMMLEEEPRLHGDRVSVGDRELLGCRRQYIPLHLVKERPRPDHGQDDVNQVADIEHERDDRDVVEELPAAAHEQGDPHPANHHVIREIGDIEQFAHRQPGKLLHEQDAGLAAEQPLLPSGHHRIEVIRGRTCGSASRSRRRTPCRAAPGRSGGGSRARGSWGTGRKPGSGRGRRSSPATCMPSNRGQCGTVSL